MIRVARPGGIVSAIACFCHSGGLQHYHGRYPLTGNHRIDELDAALHSLWRRHVRPNVMGYQHNVLNLDLLWQFQVAGLEEVEINGHLVLVSPGDTRIPAEVGQTYALARHEREIQGLLDMWEQYGGVLREAGFGQDEFDELVALKRARYENLQNDPMRVRQVMEVFTEPLMIIRGRVPVRSV